MYPELYQKWFQLNLNPTELVLIEILMKIVGLLSKATLGHLADNLPLPILAASRLKTLQRFLDSPRFCKEKIWWGIWMEIMTGYWLKQEPIVLAIDRTSWRKYNLLVVSWIIQGRAIPINWQLLDKLGSSNLDDQQSVIHPITCLLPEHSFVLLGDREFCSKHLATWLLEIGWGYCLRLKKSTYVRLENDDLVTLQQLAAHPGVQIFLQGVNISTTAHKFPFNVAIHYPKEHHGMPIEEGWFILTTLPTLTTAVQAYATRFQLEEMFRDYKSYGFNLELTQLNGSRFDAWFLLLTLVYSVLAFVGLSITQTQQKYLARTTELKRQYPRRSIVTLGKTALLAGFDWAFISRLVSRYIKINCHKINYYVRGLNCCNRYLVRV
jgi:Transposase DDE domain